MIVSMYVVSWLHFGESLQHTTRTAQERTGKRFFIPGERVVSLSYADCNNPLDTVPLWDMPQAVVMWHFSVSSSTAESAI